VVFHPTGATTLKALYGEAFRAPTTLEQMLFDQTGLSRNPDIGPERIRTAEFVVEQRLGPGLHATVSAFDYRMRDLIVQVVDGAGANLSYRNLDRVTGKGLDVGVNGHFPSGVSLFANASFQHSENPATRQPLPNSPSTLLRVGASAPVAWGLRLAGTVRHDGARTSLRGASTDAYTLVDASLISGRVGSFEASLSVANLFDAAYRHPTGLEHRQVAMTQMGRTLRLSVSAHF
jgi:iron complex outermembrane receptor protein